MGGSGSMSTSVGGGSGERGYLKALVGGNCRNFVTPSITCLENIRETEAV